MKKVMVSLSGGLDSAVLLGMLYEGYKVGNIEQVIAISFDYGSTHGLWEGLAAKAIAEHYNFEHHRLGMANIFDNFESALLGSEGAEDIPEGHYKDLVMKATVVPARNMIFLSVLAGLAITRRCDTIGIGIHSGDHHISRL